MKGRSYRHPSSEFEKGGVMTSLLGAGSSGYMGVDPVLAEDMVEGLLTVATECERSLADLYSVMMQVGSPELQPYVNQVTVSLELSSGRYRAIAYELAVRAGIIENYQLTRFGDVEELGEFLGS